MVRAATVFADVRNDMRIPQEEIFGPVLGHPLRGGEGAVRLPNDSKFGREFGREGLESYLGLESIVSRPA